MWSWILLAVLVGYGWFVHQGVGPAKPGGNWYNPTGFLYRWGFTEPLLQSGAVAAGFLCAPALLLAGAVFGMGRSAIGRAVAISCVISVAVFAFYGVDVPFVWSLFHWRASAVAALTSLFVGFALAAPLLARSWLRQSWLLRFATYLPLAFGMLAFIRNATGTNDQLDFAISPWPAVAVFGIEAAGSFVLMVLTGVAIGLGGLDCGRLQTRRSARTVSLAALVAALLVPGLMLLIGSALELFPFKASVGLAAAISVAVGVSIAAASRVGGRFELLRARRRWVAVGAALIALPLLSGQALARYDYYVTREHYARAITDALAAYLEREELYPDDLETLVAVGDLEAIHRPRVGFGFLNEDEFRYQNFGTSFLLEFSAPRWVECAYTPPYEYEDEDFEEGEQLEFEEAWSCPSAPPELW